jgi:membrane-bound ClpP family serine protease
MREAIDRLWEQLDPAAPWKGTLTVLAALLVLLLLRRFLEPDARGRVRMPAGFLVAALVFRAAAFAAAGAGSNSASVLGLLAVLCFVVGMVALAGLLVFDVAFRRHAVPAVIRDFAQVVVVLAIFVATLYQHGSIRSRRRHRQRAHRGRRLRAARNDRERVRRACALLEGEFGIAIDRGDRRWASAITAVDHHQRRTATR